MQSKYGIPYPFQSGTYHSNVSKRNTLNFLKKHKLCAHYIANLGHINAFFKRCFFIFMFFIVVRSVVQFSSDSILLLLFVSLNVTKYQFFFSLLVICLLFFSWFNFFLFLFEFNLAIAATRRPALAVTLQSFRSCHC